MIKMKNNRIVRMNRKDAPTIDLINWGIYSNYYVHMNVYEINPYDTEDTMYRSGLLFFINEGKNVKEIDTKNGKFIIMLTDVISDDYMETIFQTLENVKNLYSKLSATCTVFGLDGEVLDELNLNEIVDDYDDEIEEAFRESQGKTLH